MKMKLIIILTLMIVSTNNSYAQIKLKDTINYQISYNFSYQENKEDTLSRKTEAMVLKISNTFSYYINYNNMKMREMISNYKNKSSSIPVIRSRPKTRLVSTILKDYKNKELNFSNLVGQRYYYYTQPLNIFEWKLVNEKKEILGYQCKKATTTFAGRDYVAWYAIDIPISDGPYKFNGLPGLIFSIYDTKEHYTFNINSIEETNEIFNTEDDIFSHQKISQNDYAELERKFKEKPSVLMNSGGLKFPKELLEKADRIAKERLKYENNPMELKDDDE